MTGARCIIEYILRCSADLPELTGDKKWTAPEQEQLQHHLKEAAKILFENTPSEQVQDFDSIELTVRKHVLDTVAPDIASFFLQNRDWTKAGKTRKVNSCIGEVTITTKQAKKLKERKKKAHEL